MIDYKQQIIDAINQNKTACQDLSDTAWVDRKNFMILVAKIIKVYPEAHTLSLAAKASIKHYLWTKGEWIKIKGLTGPELVQLRAITFEAASTISHQYSEENADVFEQNLRERYPYNIAHYIYNNTTEFLQIHKLTTHEIGTELHKALCEQGPGTIQYYEQEQMLNLHHDLPQQQEQHMEIKEQTLINGVPLEELDDSALIHHISSLESKIEKRKAVKTSSVKIKANIEHMEAQCKKLAEFLDARDDDGTS